MLMAQHSERRRHNVFVATDNLSSAFPPHERVTRMRFTPDALRDTTTPSGVGSELPLGGCCSGLWPFGDGALEETYLDFSQASTPLWHGVACSFLAFQSIIMLTFVNGHWSKQRWALVVPQLVFGAVFVLGAFALLVLAKWKPFPWRGKYSERVAVVGHGLWSLLGALTYYDAIQTCDSGYMRGYRRDECLEQAPDFRLFVAMCSAIVCRPRFPFVVALVAFPPVVAAPLSRLFASVLVTAGGASVAYYTWLPSSLGWVALLLPLFAADEVASRKRFVTHAQMQSRLSSAQAAKRELDACMLSIVAPSVLERLVAGELVADRMPASVIFSDIVGFTAWSSGQRPQQVIGMLNAMYQQFDAGLVHFHIDKVTTIGDAYWAACGIPNPAPAGRHAFFAVAFASLVMLRAAKGVRSRHLISGIRIGIATGFVYGGVLGGNDVSYQLLGTTSDEAERLEQAASLNGLLVCGNTVQALRVDPGDDAAPNHHPLSDAEGGNPLLEVTSDAVDADRRKSATGDEGIFVNVPRPLGAAGRRRQVRLVWRSSLACPQHYEVMIFSGARPQPEERPRCCGMDADEDGRLEMVPSSSQFLAAQLTPDESLTLTRNLEKLTTVAPPARVDLPALRAVKEQRRGPFGLVGFVDADVASAFQRHRRRVFLTKAAPLAVSLLLDNVFYAAFSVLAIADLGDGGQLSSPTAPYHVWAWWTLGASLALVVSSAGLLSRAATVHPAVHLGHLLAVSLAHLSICVTGPPRFALSADGRVPVYLGLFMLLVVGFPFGWTLWLLLFAFCGFVIPFTVAVAVAFPGAGGVSLTIFNTWTIFIAAIATGIDDFQRQAQECLDEYITEQADAQIHSEHAATLRLWQKAMPAFVVGELTAWVDNGRLGFIGHTFERVAVMFLRCGSRHPPNSTAAAHRVIGPVAEKDDDDDDASASLRAFASIRASSDAVDHAIQCCGLGLVQRIKALGDVFLLVAGMSTAGARCDMICGVDGGDDDDDVASGGGDRGSGMEFTQTATWIGGDGSGSQHMADTVADSTQPPLNTGDGGGRRDDGILQLIALVRTVSWMRQRPTDGEQSLRHDDDTTAGIHTGPVAGGIIGDSRLLYDIFGDTVNTASRVMTTSPAGGGIYLSARAVRLLRRHASVVTCSQQGETQGTTCSENDDSSTALQLVVVLPGGTSHGGDGGKGAMDMTLSPVAVRAAKGKGELKVRDVLYCHLQV